MSTPENEPFTLSPSEKAMATFILGTMHANAMQYPDSVVGVAMVRASLPLAKKLGININASDLYPETLLTKP